MINYVKTIAGIILLVILTCHLSAVADSLLRESSGLCDMYGNKTARNVGDVLTILFKEKTVSRQSARGKLKNTFSTGADEGKGWLEKIFAGLGLSGGETTNVESTTIQEHSLDAMMTATVVEVLPGNQLRIEGFKSLEVNHEKQKLTITGTIREMDIGPNNTIISGKIGNLNAQINGLPIEKSLQKRRGGLIRWVWGLIF